MFNKVLLIGRLTEALKAPECKRRNGIKKNGKKVESSTGRILRKLKIFRQILRTAENKIQISSVNDRDIIYRE